MYIGLDIGTSGVKALLIGEDFAPVGQAHAALTVSRPHHGWSEQDPDSWITACEAAMDELAKAHPDAMARLAGIGLSGQMHGATLLDADDRPLRPMLRSGEYSGADWADEAVQHGLRDYIYEDGHIRIWGDVASVLTFAFEPPAIEKSWPHRPGHNAASANDDQEKTP